MVSLISPRLCPYLNKHRVGHYEAALFGFVRTFSLTKYFIVSFKAWLWQLKTVRYSDQVFYVDFPLEHLILEMDVSESQWYALNLRQMGFYRVNYDMANWHSLTKALCTSHMVGIPARFNKSNCSVLIFPIAHGSLLYISGTATADACPTDWRQFPHSQVNYHWHLGWINLLNYFANVHCKRLCLIIMFPSHL